MDISSNKTPVEVIREGAFGGTYFRDIYSSINDAKNIDTKFYASDCYGVNVNKCGVKCGTPLRF